jgi:hypothetical protein
MCKGEVDGQGAQRRKLASRALEAPNSNSLRRMQPWRSIRWSASNQSRGLRRHSSNFTHGRATCHAHTSSYKPSPCVFAAMLAMVCGAVNYAHVCVRDQIIRRWEWISQKLRRLAEPVITCPVFRYSSIRAPTHALYSHSHLPL